MNTRKDLLKTLIDLLDGIVEVFLVSVIEPLLAVYGQADRGIDRFLRQLLQEHKENIPTWILQEGAISYFRIGLAIPTIVLLSWGYSFLASFVVVVVLSASFWERVVPDTCSDHCMDTNNEGDEGEEDSFEVVTTGSPQSIPSWPRLHRARMYTGWASDMVDRAFAIACWISLIHSIPRTGQFHMAQYLTMIALVVMETVHSCLSFSKFLTTHLISPPQFNDMDILGTRFNHGHLQKIKQTLEFSGIALFILPLTRYLGLLLVVVAVPLEYELVREATRKRVLYFVETSKSFDHKKLKSWMQMKSLASKLIVGVPRRDSMDMVMNACATNVVDEVVVEAPTKVDLLFIEMQQIDFVVILTPGQTNVVTEEVINANRVLLLNDQGHLLRVRPKSPSLKE